MPSAEWSAASARVKPAIAALVVSYLQVAAACDDGPHGGGVNDGTAPVAAHQRNRRLGAEDVAHQVDAEDLVPARSTRLVHLLVFADAGIVDEDVEPPERLRGTVDEAEACGLGTNVSLREGDLGAGGLELGRHALAALAVPIAECHARALGAKRRTVASPIPDAPPVTAATLPSSLPMFAPFIALRNAHPRYVVSVPRAPPCWPARVSDPNRLRKLQASGNGWSRRPASTAASARLAPDSRGYPARSPATPVLRAASRIDPSPVNRITADAGDTNSPLTRVRKLIRSALGPC